MCLPAFLRIVPASWLLTLWNSEQADDHVARMARFGLRCVAAASETAVDPEDQSQGFVRIRSGFHTGPVVGNVVGTKYR
jgi:class 3 adenylate cyclase